MHDARNHPRSRREAHFGDNRLWPFGAGREAVESFDVCAARCQAASDPSTFSREDQTGKQIPARRPATGPRPYSRKARGKG
jgi:hypothetical protein